jgi:oxalate decarboxylase/phosphoglucose isomerase-like protein (cupin superfamily)
MVTSSIREIHWHPNADEWLFNISVKRRALVRRVFAEALEWERRGLTPGD